MVVIEETVTIKASTDTVWALLIDPCAWSGWCSVTGDALGPSRGAMVGRPIQFSIKVMGVRILLEPTVEVVEEKSRLVWGGTKFGVRSRHEFLLISDSEGTRLESRERLWGLPTYLPGFPLAHLKKLTRIMLNELKQAAEATGEVS